MWSLKKKAPQEQDFYNAHTCSGRMQKRTLDAYNQYQSQIWYVKFQDRNIEGQIQGGKIVIEK